MDERNQSGNQLLPSIAQTIPHRYPFLLIDRITAFTPGVRIEGVKNFSVNDAMLPRYGPGAPFVPGGLLIEAVTQLGAILVLERPEMKNKVAMILQIPSAMMLRPVSPGESIRFEAHVLKLGETHGALEGFGYVGKERVAEGRMRFAITDKSAISEQAVTRDKGRGMSNSKDAF